MNESDNRNPIPEPRRRFGAGYLYHYHPKYQDYAPKLAAVGGRADIYEVLGVQFNSEPDAIETFAESLGKPITLHSFECCLGNVQRPPQRVTDRIQQLARLSKAAYIGEHVAMMGTRDYYCGGFLQPPSTDEQTEVLINNIKAVKASSCCPIIIENPSQFYNQVGPKSIGQQMCEVAKESGVGILLSLSNITISDRFRPQDREALLAEIPMRLVRQVHALCGNQQEERMPGMEKARWEQEWIINTLQQLAKQPELRPAAVIFELEAGTPSMAEPERLRDWMDMARDLFFRDDAWTTGKQERQVFSPTV
jgi:uncharacterized protein (UPF0276 family)